MNQTVKTIREMEAEIERLRDVGQRACNLADSAGRTRNPRGDGYHRDVARLRALLQPQTNELEETPGSRPEPVIRHSTFVAEYPEAAEREIQVTLRLSYRDAVVVASNMAALDDVGACRSVRDALQETYINYRARVADAQ